MITMVSYLNIFMIHIVTPNRLMATISISISIKEKNQAVA